MQKEQIKIRIQKIVCEISKNNTIIINESMPIKTLQNWDSVVQMIFISKIEEEFQIKFLLKELINITTIGNLIDCIDKKLMK